MDTQKTNTYLIKVRPLFSFHRLEKFGEHIVRLTVPETVSSDDAAMEIDAVHEKLQKQADSCPDDDYSIETLMDSVCTENGWEWSHAEIAAIVRLS